MFSIQQSNNYNLNCLDTVFLVSTCNRTTLETLITLSSAFSNVSMVVLLHVETSNTVSNLYIYIHIDVHVAS